VSLPQICATGWHPMLAIAIPEAGRAYMTQQVMVTAW
jgi:hypothetical protein